MYWGQFMMFFGTPLALYVAVQILSSSVQRCKEKIVDFVIYMKQLPSDKPETFHSSSVLVEAIDPFTIGDVRCHHKDGGWHIMTSAGCKVTDCTVNITYEYKDSLFRLVKDAISVPATKTELVDILKRTIPPADFSLMLHRKLNAVMIILAQRPDGEIQKRGLTIKMMSIFNQLAGPKGDFALNMDVTLGEVLKLTDERIEVCDEGQWLFYGSQRAHMIKLSRSYEFTLGDVLQLVQ
jgi:hypothetical protein